MNVRFGRKIKIMGKTGVEVMSVLAAAAASSKPRHHFIMKR
jgi:hypothetical protein